jgi:C4-dicarboxylate transporter DctM subunit
MLFTAIFGLFFAIALAGVPLVYALLGTSLLTIELLGRGYPVEAIVFTFIGGVEGLHFVAIPLFIVAGELGTRGDETLRNVDARFVQPRDT